MSIKCQYGPTNTYIVATPLGDYEVVCCPKGLHDLGMVGSVNDANFTPKPGIKVCLKSQQYEDNGYTYKPATDCVNWLEAYFSTKDKRDCNKHICPRNYNNTTIYNRFNNNCNVFANN
ncbi:hypothetical protein MAR_028872 [Mya arenaria]|nr:hypothetical protein MAR_028872 [Mya arenaria]